MTRLEALERVAEAAHQARRDGWVAPLYAALDALDALPPATEPEREVVEVRINLWRNVDTNDWCPVMEEDDDPSDQSPWWKHAATIRARVPLPRVPEVVGEVEG